MPSISTVSLSDLSPAPLLLTTLHQSPQTPTATGATYGLTDSEIQAIPTYRDEIAGAEYNRRRDNEAGSAYSAHSQGSQASSGLDTDGFLVRGLLQNLKHFLDAMKALRKFIGFWAKFTSPELSVRAANVRDTLDGVRYTLMRYLPEMKRLDEGERA